MSQMKYDLFDLQVLLDHEAALANQRYEVHKEIRSRIKDMPKPPCFGEDDCSTEMLSRCPWRIDCGS